MMRRKRHVVEAAVSEDSRGDRPETADYLSDILTVLEEIRDDMRAVRDSVEERDRQRSM